jgi:hypothetical protein
VYIRDAYALGDSDVFVIGAGPARGCENTLHLVEIGPGGRTRVAGPLPICGPDYKLAHDGDALLLTGRGANGRNRQYRYQPWP